MSYDVLSLILIVVLFIGGLVLNFLNNKFSKLYKAMFIAVGFLFIMISFFMGYIVFYKNTVLILNFKGYNSLNLYIDAFSMLLILIVSIVYLTFMIFSIKDLNDENKRYYSLVVAFISSVIVFLMVSDLFIMYIMTEIMFLSQFFLVKSKNTDDIKTSLNYILFQSLTSIFIFIAIMLLYVPFRTFNIAQIADILKDSRHQPLIIISFALLISGYGAKLLIIPFHNILSKMQTISAFSTSSVTVTGIFIAGIYSIIRISFMLFEGHKFYIQWLFIIWGTIVIVVGAIKALKENNLKKLITYIAISQVGYMICGIGIALISQSESMKVGMYGTLYHIISTCLFIPLLYFCSDAIKNLTNTYDIDKISGFNNNNKLIVICFIMGIFSAMGIPLFNGYISKWILYKSFLTSDFVPIAIISGICILLTFISLIKVLYSMLLKGEGKSEFEIVSRFKKISILILTIMCFLTGLFPQFIINGFIYPALEDIYNRETYIYDIFGRNLNEASKIDLTITSENAFSLSNEITPLRWLTIIVVLAVVMYVGFMFIKLLTGRSLKNKLHKDIEDDKTYDESHEFTSSEMIFSLNNIFGKYFKIFEKMRTDNLNDYVLILFSSFVILIIYIFAFIQFGG